MYYPGGKAKTFQHIINHIPPHEVYIEPFFGVGSVMKSKKRAAIEIGIDLDRNILEQSSLKELGINLIHENGIRFIKNYSFEGHEVVYCDPPYYPKTRKRQRVYQHDLTENDHHDFLSVITNINAKILISGYDNDVYRNYLDGWNKYYFSAKAHDGVREECLWFNFPEPAELHDYRYLGANYRERQTIQRRLERMKNRLNSLSHKEQSYLRDWLNERANPDAT